MCGSAKKQAYSAIRDNEVRQMVEMIVQAALVGF